MKLSTSIVIVIFLYSINSLGQQTKIDSLKQAFQKTTNENELITIQEDIFQEFIATKETADIHKYLDTLFTLKKIKSNPNLLALAFKFKGKLYAYEGKFNASTLKYEKGISLIKNLESNKIAGDLYLNISNNLSETNQLDSLLFYAQKAEKIYLTTKNYRGLCYFHYNISIFYLKQNDYSNCEFHLNKLLHFNKYYKNIYFDGQSYYLLGVLHSTLFNFEDAIDNIEKALIYFKKGKFHRESMGSLFMLGTIFNYNKDIIKSEKKYKEGFKLYSEYQIPISDVYAVQILNYTDLLIKLEKIEEAQENLKLASRLYKKHGFYMAKQLININQAEIYIYYNDLKKAEQELNKISFDNFDTQVKLGYFETLIKLFKKTKNLKELGPVYEKYINLKDSLSKVNLQKNIVYNSGKLNTEKKEAENLQLKTEKATQQIILEKERTKKWLLGGGMGVSLITLVVFGYYYKRNKKQKELIENLQKELHHRVKNNLSIIDTFIEVAKEEFTDIQFQSKLTELQNRIASINQIHKQLYVNKNITSLNLNNYISSLSKNIQHSFLNDGILINQNIHKNIEIEVSKSFPIGLIVNEFITNSYKYAFNNSSNGIIDVSINDEGKNYTISLKDNGKGLPTDFNLNETNTFGIRIMKLLTDQLNGTFQLSNNNGVQLIIEIAK